MSLARFVYYTFTPAKTEDYANANPFSGTDPQQSVQPDPAADAQKTEH